MKTALKAVLSVLIVYHLLVILIMPNSYSFVGRTLGQYFLTYANTLGLNVNWSFFSPDPANTMYIRYVVHFENQQGEDLKEPLEAFFPSYGGAPVIDPGQRRYLYGMRFLVTDPDRIRDVFIPWVCRQYPEATRVSASHVIEQMPSLDISSRMEKERDEIKFSSVEQYCQRGGEI